MIPCTVLPHELFIDQLAKSVRGKVELIFEAENNSSCVAFLQINCEYLSIGNCLYHFLERLPHVIQGIFLAL
jgi:hypothetical protein